MLRRLVLASYKLIPTVKKVFNIFYANNINIIILHYYS